MRCSGGTSMARRVQSSGSGVSARMRRRRCGNECKPATCVTVTAQQQPLPEQPSEGMPTESLDAVREKPFPERLRVAWNTLFPRKDDETARREAKKRLRMVLVADRCALTSEAMDSMKSRIVHAVSDFVEVEQTQDVNVSLSEDESVGTLYAVSIPVRRVHPAASAANTPAPDMPDLPPSSPSSSSSGTSNSSRNERSQWRIY